MFKAVQLSADVQVSQKNGQGKHRELLLKKPVKQEEQVRRLVAASIEHEEHPGVQGRQRPSMTAYPASHVVQLRKAEQLEHWGWAHEAEQSPLVRVNPVRQPRQRLVLVGEQSRQFGVLQLKQIPLLGVGT